MLEISLPSGRPDVRIKKVTSDFMTGLYNAQKYKLPHLLVDTLNHFTDANIREMYLEDFRYMLAMFDKDSWPRSHRMYEWRCTRPYYIDMRGERFYTRPLDRTYQELQCNMLNTEEVSKFRTVTNKWRTMPQGLRHPTVQRWIEAYVLSESIGPIALQAMYIDSDLSLEDTIANTPPDELMNVIPHMFEICELETTFKCGRCFRSYTQRTSVDLLGYLRVYSDASMMNMSMDLTTNKGSYIPDDITIEKLLYWHSCFIKDMQRAKEEAALQRGKRGIGRK